MFYCSGNHKKT